MSAIEGLLKAYQRFLQLPWQDNLAGPQKVWFAIYEPAQERRLRHRLTNFEVATWNAGHGWALLDLTDSFARWMAAHEYREEYFQEPGFLEPALADFATALAEQARQALTAATVDANTVVGIHGLASLFGVARVSAVVEAVAGDVRGRLLVFFPGQHDGSNYRLLDARDGWNYLAVPIEATEGD
jgi:hypothetical protein